MARGDLSDAEWELIEPFLPVGERGPVLDLRRLFNSVMWGFRAGCSWRDVPEEDGSWSTVYGAFQRWAVAGTFWRLMEGMIAEAAARGQVDLDLVSVDSMVARAHHHAAGMAPDPELLDELEKVITEERGLLEGGQSTSIVLPDEDGDDVAREERRRLRLRRRARLRVAELGRSRGGLSTKTHLAAERRCRPLSRFRPASDLV